MTTQSHPLPTLDLSLSSSLHPELTIEYEPTDCALHLVLDLPDTLFPDPDELADKWGPSGSIARPNTIYPRWSLMGGPVDIERPLGNPATSGNSGDIESHWGRHEKHAKRPDERDGQTRALRLSMAIPPGVQKTVVPLHARYLPPLRPMGAFTPLRRSLEHLHHALVNEGNDAAPEHGHTVTLFGPADALRHGGRISAGLACGADIGVNPGAVDVVEVQGAEVRGWVPAPEAAYWLAVEAVTTTVVCLSWLWIVFKIIRVAYRRSSVAVGKVAKSE